MTSALPIRLEFAPGVPALVQARMRYAFQVHAALYGHPLVENDAIPGTICLFYSADPPSPEHPDKVYLPARYVLREGTGVPPGPVKHRFAGEEFPLFYGLDERTKQPDWLAEIFEWLSSSRERISPQRDALGRIPLSETPFGRYGLSPRIPHAQKIMAWFEGVALCGQKEGRLRRPASPIPGARHVVICTHDIDFYYTDRASLLVRLLKNLVIAFHVYRSWEFFRWNLSSLSRLLVDRRAGDYLPALMDACEEHGFRSTLFVVANHLHRKDPNYSLRQITPVLKEGRRRGFSIGLHGSYQSIIERNNLVGEVSALLTAVNAFPMGGRQHYLRFDRHEALFSAVERAGLVYDSTMGFADTVGFRNGVAFPFPPYDFAQERAHNFLEIPLVLMDGGLEAECRKSGEKPTMVAEEVLEASREWGWGGIGIDWHNPIEAIQVPPAINNAFWQCLQKKGEHQECWIGGDEFLRACLGRYQAASLLQDIRANA